MAKEHAMIESGRRQSLGKRIWKNRWVYLFLLPGIAFVLLFCYGPMYGLVVAFKDYKISKGILGSPWANPWYNNFAMMFKDKKFNAAFFNTIGMGLALPASPARSFWRCCSTNCGVGTTRIPCR